MTTPPKRAALAGLPSNKPAPETALEPVADAPASKGHSTLKDGRRGYTLRLDAVVLKELGRMALDEDKQVRDLMIEALNDLFRKRGKPPIAG